MNNEVFDVKVVFIDGITLTIPDVNHITRGEDDSICFWLHYTGSLILRSALRVKDIEYYREVDNER